MTLSKTLWAPASCSVKWVNNTCFTEFSQGSNELIQEHVGKYKVMHEYKRLFSPILYLVSSANVYWVLHEQSLLGSLLYPEPLMWKSPATTTPDAWDFTLAPYSTGARRQWKQKLGNMQSMELQKPRTTRSLPYSSTGSPLTPLASHCYISSPNSCSWLGTLAGVAPEIKIAP